MLEDGEGWLLGRGLHGVRGMKVDFCERVRL